MRHPSHPGSPLDDQQGSSLSPGEVSWEALNGSAPTLQAAEGQRVNRKALLFLLGILAVLAVLALLVFKSRQAGDVAKDNTVVRSEEVVIPELPGEPALPPLTQTAPAEVSVPPLPEPIPLLPPPRALDAADSVRSQPSLTERRMMGFSGGSTRPDGESAANEAYMQAVLASQAGIERTQPPSTSERAESVQFLASPDTLLVRGTYIRCALETRIVTDLDGFTSCVVTEPVHSINGRRLLLPKGSKVLGKYGGGDARRERVAVIWDRIITPTGTDVTMASPGVDGLGGAGHPGDYSAHWGSRVASALLISVISDAFKYAGEKHGPVSTTTYGNGFVVEQPFQSNTARTVEQLAQQAVDESLRRHPTVTIAQGSIVNIYVAKDVDFGGVFAE